MSRQQIRTLQTILEQQADNCVALTYTLDLPFFEYMLFEPLYNGGCRNVTILCDPGQYDTALDDIPALKHLGQRYLCLPSTIAKAAFHPKLILLTSNEAGLLLVGSGNISRSGLTHNQEVWTKFSYTDGANDKFGWAACRWAFDYLSRLAEAQQEPTLQQRLEQLRDTTGWLRQEPEPSEESSFWLLHNLDCPILDQLLDRWAEYDNSPVKEAVIVSPYFDRRSLAFEVLLERLRPERISLITEYEAPGLDPNALRRLLDSAGVSLDSQRLELDSRRLHAKILALRTEQGSWMLTGSPNFSRPAMLRSVRDGNAEMAALRYEPDPAYMDLIMAPITEKALPMELDWTPISEETDEPIEDERPSYRLIRVEVVDQRLSILVEPNVPQHARLRVELSGQEAKFFEVSQWEQDGETIFLELPEDVLHVLSTPTSIRLIVESSDARELSTRAIVNNSFALQANSRPVRRPEHTVVSERLVSEDFTQDIELLNRLQNLLAMNPQQLREFRGISKQAVEELQREDTMAVGDEDYDPEAMVVDERVRRIEVQTGGDLYVDFYERAFYEDILAAARAAVYRSMSETATENSSLYESNSTSDPAQLSEMEKVTRQFTKLAKNFERGMQDSEYLAQVPATYLRELFFILTTFLRSLWRYKRIDDENFFDLSKRFFAALLGDEREVTGWSMISHTTSKEELTPDESQPHFKEQAWLHLYLLADYALIEDEELLPDLARLLRLAERELSSPCVLASLPEDTLAAMWRNNFALDRTAPDTQAAVGDLIEYSQWYSEETLRQEIKQSLMVRVSIERVGAWDLPAVPIMRVEGAWNDSHLDTYWQTFVKFCRWPNWKRNARLEVYDSNPSLGRFDTKRMILFYRSGFRQLTIWVIPDDKKLACKQTVSISLQELYEIDGFEGVTNLS